MKGVWEKYGYSRQTGYASFHEYWTKSLHNGVSESPMNSAESLTYSSTSVSAAAETIAKASSTGWELELYSKTAIADGAQADNPWLQELPDPVSKVVWDNYIAMNPSDMTEMGLNTKIGQQAPARWARFRPMVIPWNCLCILCRVKNVKR